MSRIPTEGIDYTSKDYESFRNDMINQLRVKMPEYTDIRQSDAGIVILELLAQGLDVISYYQDVFANEAFLVTEEQMSNVLKWCKMLNYTPKTSTPAQFTQVFVLGSAQSTDTVIPKGTLVKTQDTSTEPSVYFETMSDLIIPAGKLGDETDENGEYLYTVKVLHGIPVSGELLGSSTGSPNQIFKLNYSPAILDSIDVLVNEGSGFEQWHRVDNFIDSSSTSKDYLVTFDNNNEVTVTFGDGVFGKIPKTYQNGIYCNYRVGGGTQGNVGANKITLMDSNIALVSGTFNPSVADIEGQDKETLEEIKRNAPVAYRTSWGALTIKDFSDIVKSNFLAIDKASSYVTGNGRDVAIYVLLKNDAEITEELEKEILDLFDENKGGRKLIGVGDVHLYPAVKTPVNITATLAVKPRYDFETVKANIIAFLTDYFAVGNRDFDTEVSLSELSAEIMNPVNSIDGIRVFKITSPEEDVLIPSNGAIHTLGSVTIVNGGV